jgi:adenylosuccinate synthase
LANVAVVGAQWGDEGKGKIVDWLSNRADMVVRFQGGHNAGHTLVVDGKVYKLALLPSGRGAGQAFDHRQWRGRRSLASGRRDREDRGARASRINPGIADVADNACLILPIHPGAGRRARGGGERAGRQDRHDGRGIGPAYEDKVGRRAIRVCDLANAEDLKVKIDRLRAHHDPLRAGLGLESIDPDALLASAARDRAENPALCPAGLAGAGSGPAGWQAGAVRGRTGRFPRRGSRHLSLCHELEHRGRTGRGRLRHRAEAASAMCWGS